MDSNLSTDTEATSENPTMTSNLPEINLDNAEMTRSVFNKIADGIIAASSYAKRFEEQEDRIKQLTLAIEAANAREAEAYRQRDEARAEAASAKHDAQMAREAYDTVNERRIMAETQFTEVSQRNADLFNELEVNKRLLSLACNERDGNYELLGIALAERDNYRESSYREQSEKELAQLRVMELEEANTSLGQKAEDTAAELDIRDRALNECCDRVEVLKIEKATLETQLSGRQAEVHVLTDRLSHYEKDIERLAQDAANYKERLRGVRNMVGGDI